MRVAELVSGTAFAGSSLSDDFDALVELALASIQRDRCNIQDRSCQLNQRDVIRSGQRRSKQRPIPSCKRLIQELLWRFFVAGVYDELLYVPRYSIHHYLLYFGLP